MEKERKQQEIQSKAIDFARELSVGAVSTTIYSGGQIVKAAIDASGNVLGRMAENNDPVVFGLTSASALLFLEWLVDSWPEFGKFFHLDILASKWGPGADLKGAIQGLEDNLKSCRQKWYDAGYTESDSSYVANLTDNINKAEALKTIDDIVKFIPAIGPVSVNISALTVNWLLGKTSGTDFATAASLFKCQIPPVKPPPGVSPPTPPVTQVLLGNAVAGPFRDQQAAEVSWAEYSAAFYLGHSPFDKNPYYVTEFQGKWYVAS
jgi:hypothetical protein